MTEEQRGSQTEQLFKYAVERINRDPELLPNTTLIYDIHYVDREDSWHASKKGTTKTSVLMLNPSSQSIEV
jgi:ionotropic kainate glutamate receptor 2